MPGPPGKLGFPVSSRLWQVVNLSRLLAIDSDVICQIINIISLKIKKKKPFGPLLTSLERAAGSHVSQAADEWFSEVTVMCSHGRDFALVFPLCDPSQVNTVT